MTGKITLSYLGNVDQPLIVKILTTLDTWLPAVTQFERTIRRKVINVLSEGLNNISMHGTQNSQFADKSEFKISEQNGMHKITFRNYVDIDKVAPLEAILNSMKTEDMQALQTAYDQRLFEDNLKGAKKGASIGLLTILIACHQNFSYELTKTNNDVMLLSLKVNLSANG